MSLKTSNTGDGAKKDFAVGFPFIDKSHIRVIVNNALKVEGTDYMVLEVDEGAKAIVRFVAAPTNGHSIVFTRNTPIALTAKNPTVSQIAALSALYRMQEQQMETRDLPFFFAQAGLIANTAIVIEAPCDGYIEYLRTEVTKTITTGGTIGVNVEAVPVTGLSTTIANSAVVGTIAEDTPTTPQSTTTKVRKGQRISIVPASFATAGEVRGLIRFQPADL